MDKVSPPACRVCGAPVAAVLGTVVHRDPSDHAAEAGPQTDPPDAEIAGLQYTLLTARQRFAVAEEMLECAWERADEWANAAIEEERLRKATEGRVGALERAMREALRLHAAGCNDWPALLAAALDPDESEEPPC